MTVHNKLILLWAVEQCPKFSTQPEDSLPLGKPPPKGQPSNAAQSRKLIFPEKTSDYRDQPSSPAIYQIGLP